MKIIIRSIHQVSQIMGKRDLFSFFWLGGGWSNMCNAVFKVKFDNNKFIIKLDVILFF